jgi:hypothetical protein
MSWLLSTGLQNDSVDSSIVTITLMAEGTTVRLTEMVKAAG